MTNENVTKVVPVVVTVIIVAVLSVGIFVILNKGGSSLTTEQQSNIEQDLNLEETDNMTNIQDFDELEIATIQEGSGIEAIPGNTVSVHYKGTLSDGTQFDSSYDRGIPFEFTLGDGMVITGWEEGVKGMKVGEIRELRIPSSMGYGESGSGPIPGSAGLIFTVELLEVK
jgi:FKBP-type peptidyl-prolyl cis-trans isomerase